MLRWLRKLGLILLMHLFITLCKPLAGPVESTAVICMYWVRKVHMIFSLHKRLVRRCVSQVYVFQEGTKERRETLIVAEVEIGHTT